MEKKIGFVLILFCCLILIVKSQINPFENTKSGYITINETTQANMFYWYFDAEENAESAPIILWLEGGPGIPGIFQIFFGNGPFRLEYKIPYNYTSEVIISENPLTWRKKYNMLYVDNPIGVGFSYVGDNTSYPTNEQQVGKQLFEFLRIFFTQNSNLKNNAFYVFGESYGAKYALALGSEIVKQKRLYENTVNFNFKSLGWGDGLVDPATHAENWIPYAKAIGTFGDSFAAKYSGNISSIVADIKNGNYKVASENYYTTILSMSEEIGSDIYQTMLTVAPSSYIASFMAWRSYVNTTEFRTKLNVFPHVLPPAGFSLNFYIAFEQDITKSMVDDVKFLLDSGVKILVYQGSADWIVAPAGTEQWISSVVQGWNQTIDKDWCLKTPIENYPFNSPYGVFKTVGNIARVVLKGAGHFGTHDAPYATFQLIQQWTQNATISSLKCL